MSATAELARLAAEATPPPAAIDAASAVCAALGGGKRQRPAAEGAAASVYWVGCAVLKHAGTFGSPRDDALRAVAVGLEITFRLHGSLSEHMVGGWDPVAAAVVLGSAVGSCRLAGADADTTARAMGIAATQASGFADVAATALGVFQRRRAAANGLQAADLARSGLTAPMAGLEGRRGLLALMAPTADVNVLTDGLERVWVVADQPRVAEDPPPGMADWWAAALAHAEEEVH